MIASSQDIIQAIAECLRDDVLPHVEATMPVSNIRACLMLLTYLEDRVAGEGAILAEDNAALRALLGEIAAGPGMPRLEVEWPSRIDAVLREHPAPTGYEDTARMAETNQAFQHLLTDLIRHHFEGRAELDPAAYRHFRAKVDACLLAINARGARLAHRAGEMPPL